MGWNHFICMGGDYGKIIFATKIFNRQFTYKFNFIPDDILFLIFNKSLSNMILAAQENMNCSFKFGKYSF